MDYLAQAFGEALRLIVSLDRELMAITAVSLKVACASTALGTALGLPLGAAVALAEFRGKRAVRVILNTLMALPTVAVGLFMYSLLSRRGPLGGMGLLYSPAAMVLGQCVLVTPLVAAMTLAALSKADSRIRATALSLGASPAQAALAVLSECRVALVCAIAAGFGRVFAEVGVSMMLGGNIRWYTRNLTTAIAFETSKGEFAMGLALGMVLLAVALAVNLALQLLQQERV